jgi:hypothetical protein
LNTLAWSTTRSTSPRHPFLRVAHELSTRQRALTLFAAALLLAMIPAAILLGLDDRVLRGVNVWIKPMKFMLSVAVLALTTAWFIGHLPPAQRGSRAVRAIVAMVIGAGGFEVAYITLQAALGEGSHYNVGDALHGTMYALMGIGALVLTASQPVLAWQLHRHPAASLPAAYRTAILLGLVLTFVLGAGVGVLLSAIQPPTGPSLPVVGWSTVAGDLRPAHFFGIHAQQLLPVAGALLAAARVSHARAWVWAIAAVYSAGTVALVVQALAGRPFIAL